MQAQGTFTVKKWEETPYLQLPAHRKMTKASVEYEFTGAVGGTAGIRYLMYYKHVDPTDEHKSTAVYTGLAFFEGAIDGRAGSFVMREEGTFENGTAASVFQIIDGSGTGDLAAISGTGRGLANGAGFQITLDYAL